ncbi:MAG: acyl-CoA dehydrogenase [Sphingomonadales bacterium RIFCSPHIGHO2_01_FULL_65_20]|jgi:acyl-CoA dehydrogenase|nr:MAG: acyl-CoA dehydrogenase [Sphingomonadales bacterium RIFCSPHIGHO2_01_FULL_65_20]
MTDTLNIDGAFLTEDHRLLRDQIARLVREEIVPHAEAWEVEGRTPAETFRRFGELGLLGLAFPEADGGSGMDAAASVILNEELGRSGFGGPTAALTVHSDMSALHLARVGTAEQKARFLPGILSGDRICALGVTEPRGGSDLTRIATFARRDGDDYVLNGSKIYITNANTADVFFVVARTSEDAKGGSGFSLFVVERNTPGFTNGTAFNKTGWLSSDTGELFFDNARVPAANLLGEEGKGFYYMMKGLDHERLCAAGQVLGLAQAAIDATMAWVRERQAYGRTLWDLQAIRQEMAKLVTELLAARAMTYMVALKAGRGEAIQMEGAMLKAYVPDLGNRILYKCVQYHGGSGYIRGVPVERISRDMRLLSIGGGATEVMYDEVAKRL